MKWKLSKNIFLFCTTLCQTATSLSSCASQCEHTKGNLISIQTTKTSDIDYPGIYECNKCHQTFTTSIDRDDLGISILNINGDFKYFNKENPTNVQIEYMDQNHKYDFTCNGQIKLQGDYSLIYPKKNFNLTFYSNEKKQKLKLDDRWEPMSKVTLKSNYFDALRCHNTASAKIFGDIVHSRGEESNTAQYLNPLINGGAIDSFPIALYSNKQFLGLYTLNFPKNKTLFNMGGFDGSSEQAVILSADNTSNSTSFKEVIDYSEFENNYWSVEYCSTGEESIEDYQWAVNSMNDFIHFVNDPENDGNSETWDAAIFKTNLHNYVEIDRLIDYYLFMDFGALTDGITKNILWVKYPNSKWFPSAYDMDYSFGFANKQGVKLNVHMCKPDEEIGATQQSSLWQKICRNDTFWDDIKKRYLELASGALSTENVINKYNSYYYSIPSMLYDADINQKWPDTPLKTLNDLNSFNEFINGRHEFCNKKYK